MYKEVLRLQSDHRELALAGESAFERFKAGLSGSAFREGAFIRLKIPDSPAGDDQFGIAFPRPKVP
jgi:hypothetical protein